MSGYIRKPKGISVPTCKSESLREQYRIGREMSEALDRIIPKERRMKEEAIAAQLGVSRQRVNQIKMLALYKVRMRLQELCRNHE